MLLWLTVVLRLCNTTYTNAAVIDISVEIMQHNTYTNAAVIGRDSRHVNIIPS